MKHAFCLIFGLLLGATASADFTDSLFENTPLAEERFQIKGTTTNYPQLKRDGFINFSLILPALDRKRLYEFDADNIMSPEMDKLKVAGQTLEIPSNVALPKQSEKYNFLITLKFDKPQYRFIVPEKKAYQMTALHGRFPFKKVINEMRDGKSLFEVVNYFEMLSGGERTSEVSSDMTKQDIAINQWNINSKLTINAPEFNKNTHSVISVAFLEENGLLFPTDVKGPEAGKIVELSSHTNKSDGVPHILSARIIKEAEESIALPQFDKVDLMKLPSVQNEDDSESFDFAQISLNLLPYKKNMTSVFLDDIAAPVLNGNTLNLTPPALVAGLNPMSTRVQLVEVTTIDNGEFKTKSRKILWVNYSDSWATSVDVSQVPVELDPNKAYRYEVSFAARNTTDGPETHITRNFVEL